MLFAYIFGLVSYKIDKDFYLSNTAISDLLQAKKLIGNYLNLLEEYENSYLKNIYLPQLLYSFEDYI